MVQNWTIQDILSDENGTAPGVTIDYSSYYSDMNDSAPRDFTEVGDFSRVYVLTLYSLVFFLGFLGNGLVVCVLLKYHSRKTNLTDLWLLNLAISDLIFVLTLPFYCHQIRVHIWPFGDFMCRFLSWSHHSCFFSSIFIMVVMTLYRYQVILHPHSVTRHCTIRTGTAVTLFVWLLSMSVSMPQLLLSGVNEKMECVYSEGYKVGEYYEVFSTNVLGLIIPLLVMVFCYSRIIPMLMKMKTVKKQRIVKLIISVVITFFLFWTPYNVSRFLRFLAENGTLPVHYNLEINLRLSIIVTETFAYTHCCVNPIIYAFVGQNFMKKALRLAKVWRRFSVRNWSENSMRSNSVTSRVSSTVML